MENRQSFGEVNEALQNDGVGEHEVHEHACQKRYQVALNDMEGRNACDARHGHDGARHRRHRAAKARHRLQRQQHVSRVHAELGSDRRNERGKREERSIARAHQECHNANHEAHEQNEEAHAVAQSIAQQIVQDHNGQDQDAVGKQLFGGARVRGCDQ